MPNWCYTNFVLYSENEEQLCNLFNAIHEVVNSSVSRVSNGFGPAWLGNIVDYHGLDPHTEHCRGAIVSMSEAVEVKNHNEKTFWYFNTAQETAWAPTPEMWDKILKQTYPDVQFEYCAEEPGMGLYVNTDTEGGFITDRYLLDCCLPACWGKNLYIREYFADREEMLDALLHILLDQTNLKDGDIPDEEHVIEWLQDACENADDEDAFFILAEFETE